MPDWEHWPDIGTLQALLDIAPYPVTNAAGTKLRLATPGAPTGGVGYELRVALEAVLPVRSPGWHDLFNVLAWAAFPRAKAALNARHVAQLDLERGLNRSSTRDAITGFDEDGVIVAVADPSLELLVREFQWKTLFWARRADLAKDFQVFVFGHGLAAKLLAPFVGLTAKAVFVGVDRGFDRLGRTRQRDVVDRSLADRLRSEDRFTSPRELCPLPVLGLPGWWPAAADEAFYDDQTYFRAGRLPRPAIGRLGSF